MSRKHDSQHGESKDMTLRSVKLSRLHLPEVEPPYLQGTNIAEQCRNLGGRLIPGPRIPLITMNLALLAMGRHGYEDAKKRANRVRKSEAININLAYGVRPYGVAPYTTTQTTSGRIIHVVTLSPTDETREAIESQNAVVREILRVRDCPNSTNVSVAEFVSPESADLFMGHLRKVLYAGAVLEFGLPITQLQEEGLQTQAGLTGLAPIQGI